MEKIKIYISLIRFLPILIWDSDLNVKLEMDIVRWAEIVHISGRRTVILSYLLCYYPEFRNLYIYRNRSRKIFKRWVKLFYKPMDTLYIDAFEIGGGLFIQHGFSTMIAAKSIGKNCWINQQVTIGHNGLGNAPIIGDNVYITCGAKVLGNIEVGDNVIVGANAVVIKNVENNSTMVGVPAHKIEK